jgi:hypothetical protein
MTQAVNRGMKSIVFPPLGYGQMFEYPIEVVAHAMLPAVYPFQQSPSQGIQVNLIVMLFR